MQKKTRNIWIAVIVVLIIILLIKKNSSIPQYETIAVSKGTVIQDVTLTGKVQAAQSLDLAFESPGKILDINTKVTAQVKKGDILIRQNSSDASARLRRASASVASAQGDVAQYQASLESVQVTLDQLKSGTRSEELNIARATRDQAKRALLDAKNSLENAKNTADLDLQNVYADILETVETSYTQANTAFLENLSNIFSDSADYDQLSFQTKDSVRKEILERERVTLESRMKDWRSQISSVGTDTVSRDQLLQNSKAHLGLLRTFLLSVSAAVDDSFDLSLSTQNTYRTSINTAKSLVNTAMASLVAQEQSITSQKSSNTSAIQSATTALNAAEQSLDVAENQLRLKEAGPRPEEISAQEARVKQARANVLSAQARVSQAGADYQSAQAEYQKTLLIAPIDGIVTVLNAKTGEFFAASKVVISVISEGNYEIETHVPEIDIAKLELGKTAEVTLDAYGDAVVFPAQVGKIDPAETVVDGIATYKVTLQFVQQDDRIKSGMTANTKILTQKHEGVIAIPLRALSSHDGKNFVKVQSNPKQMPSEIEVGIGLKGSDGTVEITSGLQEGQQVVLGELVQK